MAARATVAVGSISRRLRLGEGSVIGGRVGLALDPGLLASLTAGRPVALVSGTNGKTTTTRLLAAALGGPGRVATSSAGANLPAGLAAALSAAPPAVPAVLEIDEGYLPRVAEVVHPRVILLLNLSRDQLDRVSEVRMVAGRWRAAVAALEETVVVANADDPLVVWAARTAPSVRWVAAGQLWRADAGGCPACEGRIEFASDGKGWACPGCGFARPEPDDRLEGDSLVLAGGRRLPIVLALPGRCNLANAAVAAVAAGVLGVDPADALEAMGAVGDVEGRFAVVDHGGIRTRLLLAKNPAGWAELLDLIDGGTGPVVVGINARIADGHDPSWLWDVDFERLAGRLVVATGERGRDLAVRLRHAGVDHVTVPDQLRALAAAGSDTVEYVGNYTAFQDLRRLVGRDQGPAGSTGPPPCPAAAARAIPPASPALTSGPGPSALRIVVVHPDLLGTYGDGGNGRILADRAAWRGLDVELFLARSGDLVPGSGDLYCLGGGEDGPQVESAELLRGGVLNRAVEAGAAVLAVCAGYQVVGASFPGAGGSRHEGLGLLDVTTEKGTGPRAVGELLATPMGGPAGPGFSPVGLPMLTGFENHGGVTRLGAGVRPLARVQTGIGNGAGDGTEGAWSGRVVGTYLHGPVLARNPALADLLLSLATGVDLALLDDDEEEALRAERLAAVSGGRRAGRGRLVRVMSR